MKTDELVLKDFKRLPLNFDLGQRLIRKMAAGSAMYLVLALERLPHNANFRSDIAHSRALDSVARENPRQIQSKPILPNDARREDVYTEGEAPEAVSHPVTSKFPAEPR